MEDFSYQCSTRLIFGKNAEEKVGGFLYGKVLFVYGNGSIKKSGLYDRIVKSLQKAGISFIELSGVVPNPRVELVREGVKICRENGIEFILAVGGGSVIDSAKAIAAGYYYQDDVWDLFSKGIEIREALPVGVVLTIPAAGSESSRASVISNKDRKLFISSDALRPDFAILNPCLTFTLPPFQTACGISDMFAHVVERYFSNSKNVDLTDKMCEAVFRAIIRNAKLVINAPDNYDCRAEIMLASTFAHNGILGVGRIEDWGSHMIEHELSAKYDIAHGAGLAVVIPAWMKYVYNHDIKRFAQFGRAVWGLKGDDEKIAVAAIKATEDFFTGIKLPTRLSELNIDDRHFEEMAEKCSPVGEFVKLNKKDIVEILHLCK